MSIGAGIVYERWVSDSCARRSKDCGGGVAIQGIAEELSSDLCPQNPLLHSPFWTHLEEVVSRSQGALAPPTLGGGANLSPVQILPGAGVPCLQLVVS